MSECLSIVIIHCRPFLGTTVPMQAVSNSGLGRDRNHFTQPALSIFHRNGCDELKPSNDCRDAAEVSAALLPFSPRNLHNRETMENSTGSPNDRSLTELANAAFEQAKKVIQHAMEAGTPWENDAVKKVDPKTILQLGKTNGVLVVRRGALISRGTRQSSTLGDTNEESPCVAGAFFICPTRIRTWTNRTKICCATVTLSGIPVGWRNLSDAAEGWQGSNGGESGIFLEGESRFLALPTPAAADFLQIHGLSRSTANGVRNPGIHALAPSPLAAGSG